MWRALEFLLYSKYFWITTIVTGIYIYLKFFIYAYWKKHGVPHEPPTIPFGNLLPVIKSKIHYGKFIRESYEKFRKYPFHGIYIFNKPVLMINDIQLIHQILIKEFDKFYDRGMFSNEILDPLSINLFLLSGEKWKKLRAKTTPTFTPSKLKEMFPFVKEISDELIKTCEKSLENDNILEMKDLMVRYTIDIISSIAYGFDGQSLSDPNNEIKRYAEKVINHSNIKNLLAACTPNIMYTLRIPYYGKEVTNFFSKKFLDAIHYREQHHIVRNDFLNVLIRLMNENIKDRITVTEAQAQSFVFFVAGFETSSTTMTFLLYELALNPEIQEKVYREINEFLAKGHVNYNRMKDELTYLDMAISETMRKYPIFPIFNRLCMADYQIPNSDFIIKKGTAIMIPVLGLHYNSEVYPDPKKFDPMRFSNNDDSIRSTYLPFGAGPKNCLGSRFAMLQLKLGLIALLSNYNFSKCEKTIIPMKYFEESFTLNPDGGLYLRMEKRMKIH